MMTTPDSDIPLKLWSSSNDNNDDDAQKRLAEDVGINFDIIKPMLNASANKLFIKHESPTEIKQEVVWDISQPDIPIAKSPLSVTHDEFPNIQPDSPMKVATQDTPDEIVKDEIAPVKVKLERTTRSRRNTPLQTKQVNQEEKPHEVKTLCLYNLRGQRRTEMVPIRRDGIWTNKKLKPDCIRERALSMITYDKYHTNSMPDDEYAKKLLEISRTTQLSQLDKFCIENRQFIVITWLSVARIFEYDSKLTRYFEVRRMPKRYVGFSGDLITCIHHSEAKLYIAYLANSDDDEKQAYIEARDLHGRLLDEPYCYSHVIRSIHSNKDFIHVKTVKNIVYIHKKSKFNFNPYVIDLRLMTNEPIININAQPITSSTNYLKIVFTTPKHLWITRRDGLQHSLWQSFDFTHLDDLDYRTVSMHYLDNNIILLRNLAGEEQCDQTMSKLDFGALRRPRLKKTSSEDYYIHEWSMSFQCQLLQVEPSADCKSLFLYGRTANRSGVFEYEVGQLALPDLKPLWCSRLYNVNKDSRLIVQRDNLVFIQECQRCFAIDLNSSFIECEQCQFKHPDLRHKACEHPGMFRATSLKYNANLTDPEESGESSMIEATSQTA